MFKQILIIVPILFSLQTFAESEHYVPAFKVTKTIGTKVQLQKSLVEDLKSLKAIFNKDSSVAVFRNVAKKEIFNNASSSL